MKARFWFSLRLLWRERRVSDVVILFWALVVAVSQSTTASVFTDRLERMLMQQGTEFLAADLAVRSARVIPATWLEQATALGLSHSQTHEFASVLLEHDTLLLTRIKAVSQNYPLRGVLDVRGTEPESSQSYHQGPADGTVWVDGQVLATLKLKPGESLQVGERSLIIAHELLNEPDQAMNMASLAPRVLMNAADLATTGLLQPGSHIEHRLQLTGPPSALDAFRGWLGPQLLPGERLLDLRQDRPDFDSVLQQARHYLGLISTAVMLMAGVAVALATRRYAVRQYDQAALLRCLGCGSRALLGIYSLQLLVMGLLAGSLGVGVGWLMQEGLFALLRTGLPRQSVPVSLSALTEGMLTGLLILAGFALPAWSRLLRVAPLRVLRRELEPSPVSTGSMAAITLALAGVLVGWQTRDTALAVTVLGGIGFGLPLLAGLAYVLLAMLRRLPLRDAGWHLACRALLCQRLASLGQIVAFSLTLTVMVLSYRVGHDLLARWQQRLPEGTPNHFVLNLFPDQREAFQTALADQGIRLNRLYPVVRGRLVDVNGSPVQTRIAPDSQAEQTTRRELNLTWAATVPDDNRLSEGRWWPATGGAGEASVEHKLAASLGLRLGDTLGFTVGASRLTATVTSFRTLDWSSLKPNFFVVFSPGTLEPYPVTYLTSFYLPPDQRTALNALVQRFPNLTPVDIGAVLRQLQGLLSQLATATGYLWLFAVVAGGLVLCAAVAMTLDSRRHEAALLRALGASRAVLLRSHLLEFGILGGVAGWMALFLAESLLYLLHSRLMEGLWQPDWRWWIGLPLASTLVLAGLGGLGLRNLLAQPPLAALRNLNSG